MVNLSRFVASKCVPIKSKLRNIRSGKKTSEGEYQKSHSTSSVSTATERCTGRRCYALFPTSSHREIVDVVQQITVCAVSDDRIEHFLHEGVLQVLGALALATIVHVLFTGRW